LATEDSVKPGHNSGLSLIQRSKMRPRLQRANLVSELVTPWDGDVSSRIFQCRKRGSSSVFVTQAKWIQYYCYISPMFKQHHFGEVVVPAIKMTVYGGAVLYGKSSREP